MKKILTLLIILIISINVFAATEQPWWMGKRITQISYSGLNHASEISINKVIDKYIGKTFSNELFDNLQTDFYDLKFFAYLTNEAFRDGDDLRINFNFFELPYIIEYKINDNSDFSKQKLRDNSLFNASGFLADNTLDVALLNLKSYADREGYPMATFSFDENFDSEKNEVSITLNSDSKKRYITKSINFEGLKAFSPTSLSKKLVSTVRTLFKSGAYNEEDLVADVTAIERYYKNKGYVDIKVSDIKKEFVEKENRFDVILTFKLEEGAQYKFGNFTITGTEADKIDKLLEDSLIDKNDIYNQSIFEAEINRIKNIYVDQGYISSSIIPTQEKINGKVNSSIEIIKREQARVTEIIIEGLQKTQDAVLRREITIKPGDIFSNKQVQISYYNIVNSGLAEGINMDIIESADSPDIKLVFKIKENLKQEIKLGISFGGSGPNEFPISGFVQWADKNLLGTSRDLAISANVGASSQSIGINFNDDWVNDIRWANGFSFSFEHSYKRDESMRGIGSPYKVFNMVDNWYPAPFASYEQWVAANKPGVDSKLSSSYLMDYHLYTIQLGYTSSYTWSFGIKQRLTLGGGLNIALKRATFDNTILAPLDGVIAKYGENFQFSNSLSLFLNWSDIDNISDPSHGYIAKTQFIYAGGILFGLSNYLRHTTTLAGYFTAFEIPREDDLSIKGIFSLSGTLDLVYPQFFKQNFGPKTGYWGAGINAHWTEMNYIDGVTIARGHNGYDENKKNLEFLLDLVADFSIPMGTRLVWFSIFGSATGAQNKMSDISSLGLNWFYSIGAGIQLKIPGFPIGLYLVKPAETVNGVSRWLPGPIFPLAGSPNSGLRFVVAISTHLF